MVENEIKALQIVKKNLNIKKVILIVILFIEIIVFINIAKNQIEIIKQQKSFEQYEIQAELLKKQDEEKRAKIEEEKKKLLEERKPKLTEKRKRKYGKYIQFREKESILNI